MYNVKLINDDTYYIGTSDRRIELFENAYPLKNGVSYNSYMIMDEKTVLIDTEDWSVGRTFMENVRHVLNGRPLDIIIVNHMEPDHAASLALVLREYPDAKVYGSMKVKDFIFQFHGLDVSDRFVMIKEGDSLNTGKHVLNFVAAPMVHWPEVMMTFDSTDGVLFSADAFGRFGALSGNIFEDEAGLWDEDLADARRYYTCIVGKYGPNVQAVLKKAAGLDIKMICPLHGTVIRKDFGKFIDLYSKWSSYEPEDRTVMIAYGSIYGGTENAAAVLAGLLADKGVKNIRMYDVSKTDVSELIAESFRVSHIVLAAPTHDAFLLSPMDILLTELKHRSLKNRTFAVIDNGTWASCAGKAMRDHLAEFKDCTVIPETLTLKSALSEDTLEQLKVLADALYKTI